jgi:hypothetical protein
LTAVSIITNIRKGRKELVEKVTVGSMKFDEVNYVQCKWEVERDNHRRMPLTTSLVGTSRRFHKGGLDFVKVLFCRRSRVWVNALMVGKLRWGID